MQKIYTIVVTLVAVFVPYFVSAASLSFSVPSDSYHVGETFSVSMLVNSPDQSINAISGSVSFSKDLLSVVSLSKSSSIISLWTQEPVFVNGDGKINFEGVILNPGFIGSSGRIITATFMVKQVGQAHVTFSSASALANDGLASNVLSGTGSITLKLLEAIAPLEKKNFSEQKQKTTEPVPVPSKSEALPIEKPTPNEELIGSVSAPQDLTISPDKAWTFVMDDIVNRVLAHTVIVLLVATMLGSVIIMNLLFAIRGVFGFLHAMRRSVPLQEIGKGLFRRRISIPEDILKKHLASLRKAKRNRDLSWEETDVLKDFEHISKK